MNFGKLKMYVGGKLIDSISKSEKTIFCPANNQPIANLSWAEKTDSENALKAAQIGFKNWSKLKLDQRKKWMDKFKEAVINNEEILRKAIIYEMGKILNDINFPAGVVNIICGEPEIVATTLSKSKIPRLITMIGSTSTAKKVYADSSTSIKRLSMELGGNAPFIVFDDADLDAAIDLAIGIKFGNSGQICVAANRFFIHDKIYDTFLRYYLERVKKLKLGFGEDSNSDMGPLINVKSRDRILDLISDSIKNGAKLEYGGKIPENFSDGNWLEPTVITNVSQDMRIFNEEIFGPVASIIKFSNDDEVLKLANSTDYGLASYIFTNNKQRIDFFSENLNFGEVQVNGIKYAIYLPHGGIKESGIGHDCSHLALYDYLTKKRISVAL